MRDFIDLKKKVSALHNILNWHQAYLIDLNNFFDKKLGVALKVTLPLSSLIIAQ